jgi:hypothetical protein
MASTEIGTISAGALRNTRLEEARSGTGRAAVDAETKAAATIAALIRPVTSTRRSPAAEPAADPR